MNSLWQQERRTVDAVRRVMAVVMFGILLFAPHPASAQVLVEPTHDIADLAKRSPIGTHFVLLAGKHYVGDILPKERQHFEGSPGAILSGAVRLGPFKRVEGRWTVSGPPPLSPSHGECDRRKLGKGSRACFLREALFVDNVRIERAPDLQSLSADTWFQDRDTGEISLGFDPGQRLVEMSYRTRGFYGTARDVTIRNLIIQHYATPAQHSPIQGHRSLGWNVENNEARFNSGSGIITGNYMRVVSNRVHSNGQIGVSGIGTGVFVENNLIYGNNTHRFSSAWEAGGTKFALTKGLIFIRNCVRDNDGHGVWTDIDNVDVMVARNWSINNAGAGIYHEIGGNAVITDNVSAFNGSAEPSAWGSQILVSGSTDTIVWRNQLVVAEKFGNGIYVVDENRPNKSRTAHDHPLYISRGNVVRGNRVEFTGSAGTSGLFNSQGEANRLADSNFFENNEIVVRDNDTARFRIGRDKIDLTEARARGQELRSRLSVRDQEGVAETPSCPEGVGFRPPTGPRN